MSIADYFPDALTRARSRGPNGRNLHQSNALLALATRIITEAGLQTSDGGTQDITTYEIDWTAGRGVVGGQGAVVAAGNDQDLLADIDVFELDGTPMTALSADGKTYDLALCLALDTNGVSMFGVVGAEADDGSEVAPTVAQIKTALAAAAALGNITGFDDKAGVVFARIKIQRVATDTITMTHVDVDGDAGLVGERAVGMLFS